MKEKLGEIDVSSIEELQRIKVEQDVIRERLQALEDKQDEVSEEVFNRVRRDYLGQVKSMEEQAEPLKVQARAQYVVLKAALVEIEASVRAATLDREELLLRNDLGEFSEEDFAAHLKECESRSSGHQDNLTEAQTLRERFLSAFHSEEELEEEAQSDSPACPPAADEGAEDDTELTEVSEPTEDAPPVPESDEADVVESLEQAPDQDTRPIVVADQMIDEPPEAASEPPQEPDGATVLLSWPKLIIQTESGDVQEMTVVGLSKTTVGSDAACDIVISGAKVADRHAEITLNENGYVIRDLSTPVGTLVNGVEITERNLTNRDTITLGDVTMTFRDDLLSNGDAD